MPISNGIFGMPSIASEGIQETAVTEDSILTDPYANPLAASSRRRDGAQTRVAVGARGRRDGTIGPGPVGEANFVPPGAACLRDLAVGPATTVRAPLDLDANHTGAIGVAIGHRHCAASEEASAEKERDSSRMDGRDETCLDGRVVVDRQRARLEAAVAAYAAPAVQDRSWLRIRRQCHLGCVTETRAACGRAVDACRCARDRASYRVERDGELVRILLPRDRRDVDVCSGFLRGNGIEANAGDDAAVERRPRKVDGVCVELVVRLDRKAHTALLGEVRARDCPEHLGLALRRVIGSPDVQLRNIGRAPPLPQAPHLRVYLVEVDSNCSVDRKTRVRRVDVPPAATVADEAKIGTTVGTIRHGVAANLAEGPQDERVLVLVDDVPVQDLSRPR